MINRWKDGCPYNHEHDNICQDAAALAERVRMLEAEVERKDKALGVAVLQVNYWSSHADALEAAVKECADHGDCGVCMDTLGALTPAAPVYKDVNDATKKEDKCLGSK